MIFTGHHARTIDSKNRLQIPSQFRSAIESDGDGGVLYVMLGERRHTLSLVTERQFELLCARVQTESMPGQDSLDFEQRFQRPYPPSNHLPCLTQISKHKG